MNNEIKALMKLQGNMRIKMLQMGLNEELAQNVACEMLHIIANSDVVPESTIKSYQDFTSQE